MNSPHPATPALLSIKALSKSYGQQRVLNDVSLQLKPGEVVAITGPSGCGKTTLLNLIAGLDSADSGEIVINGQSLKTLNEQQRTLLRRQSIGFIFQFFNLIPTLTVAENCFLPLQLNNREALRPEVTQQLERLGLGTKLHRFPEQLSGGEQQRVAIVRALAHQPLLVLADEPTGNLDQQTASSVASLLFQQIKASESALLLVTHSQPLADKADRIIQLQNYPA